MGLERIAKAPDIDDRDCDVCGEPVVAVVIQGLQRCYYCGNAVNLCQKCLDRLRSELASLP